MPHNQVLQYIPLSPLTVNARLMSDRWHHWLGRDQQVVHGVGRVSEDQLVILLGDNVLLSCYHSWVILKQLQQMIDGQLCVCVCVCVCVCENKEFG